ncbi:PEP-CTERM sorting domain-containing protein [Methylophilus medardicus]|uniref:PEP-CTERM sorting domain-containing protein n=1 Tax=Methylophilus medardicus TaxID=2588534 RepID=A0A5B8CU39_9PROT|nr:PEP-CTERM sorting domain-containing protein [Methylophilus medardicus]QDC44811.1 PEP-CTERM sorting domain-containing protein [Methylophilus medardicus]QDC49818.1 PEP-CTERM sorting domain-containing protein [Methylophilus medardicus]QDC53523.1 PEP-CTERM sorting domain-containing protein [Methylophilus medardicus]
MKLLKSLLASCLLLSSMSSQAAVEYFGVLLSGDYAPSSSFASLSVTGSGSVYDFTLTTNNLNALFTSGAFIGRLVVETDPDISLVGRNAVTLDISNLSGGVTKLSASNAGGPTGGWDFSFVLGQGEANRLTANESVSWRATFSQDVTFTNYAAHVQGLTTAQGGSAWYTPSVVTPVPEPESLGMFALGLGLLTLSARRQNKK